jgi:AraC-like DNA-binding protein
MNTHPAEALTVPPALGWERLQLATGHSACHAHRRVLEPGLTLVHSDYQPRQALAENSVNPEEPRVLVITLGLQGNSAYQSRDGSQLAFRGGHTTVSSFRHSIGQRRYAAGERVAQLRLLIEESLLARYVGAERCAALLPESGVRSLAFGRTAAASNVHAAALLPQIRPRRLPGLAKLPARAGDIPASTLDLHIHALSLLAEQLRLLPTLNILGVAKTARRRIAEADLLRVEQARELMHSQMAHPLSIAYLCARVGLSEFKLKQGCRYLYQASPYQLLLEIRMRHAWTLLENGCQVAQAGWQVGYEHPGNFSAAFTRFFGRPPKSISGLQ